MVSADTNYWAARVRRESVPALTNWAGDKMYITDTYMGTQTMESMKWL